MFSLLRWGDAEDSNGLHGHDAFGGSLSFCKAHFSDKANIASCAEKLTKGANDVCHGVMYGDGTCHEPKGYMGNIHKKSASGGGGGA
eukprot:CAMPEP_0172053242 /NCGR_PEP_ID=MMETSP1043-20130122/4107_1 /TAXON_ID=464988 /ORGANISM="Hemiselmis andersenii, Strain CCMP441" /LENGTH=86 /DNA_ID=CAMNT_0012712489 /DNA_START=243 /DNA_END=499 /DNA_ORIENTATION=-